MSSIPDLDRQIALWFEEDIGKGDHTTLSTIPSSAQGKATALAKQEGIMAGMDMARQVFTHFDSRLKMQAHMKDGDRLAPGAILFEVSGSVQSILQCERLVLNIIQRMCGIATTTHAYVKAVEGTRTRILDTRKTTPGFRHVEKEAVRIGGGVNHRFGLHDMVMIKDNHIDFAGGIEKAVAAARTYLRQQDLNLKIEVETRSLDDIRKVLKLEGIDRIMLDNFSPEQTREAVELIGGCLETESSGGITLENLRDYADCGVDYISVGALTHQVQSLDISLLADFN